MQDTVWVTAKGEHLLVSQMEESHIHMCIAKILRSTTGWRAKYLDRLQLELTIRTIKRQG